MLHRREFLRAAAGSVGWVALSSCRRSQEPEQPRWSPDAFRRPPRSRVAILKASDYDGPLRQIVIDGLNLFDLSVRGRKVVLKPNLVEFDPLGVINTHPNLIAACIEAFLELGAAEVVVAEGPGHRRDNEYLLEASGLDYVLRSTGTRYVDLNHDTVRAIGLRSRYTDLGKLYLPLTILDADLLVSLPKLKTHHWAGVTLSMKNLFGVIPGVVYGWPKNVLHWKGIGRSILDINTVLGGPRFNIVDGIVGMEGNGPIQGKAKRSGLLVFGADPVTVDSTCTRLMGLDPQRIDYLVEAGRFLGNADQSRHEHVGEDAGTLRKNYRVLEPFEGLRLG